MFEWKDFDKEKPKENWYYLCKIWENSVNQYGASTRYEVLYWSSEGAFGNLPFEEWVKGELWGYERVMWWCEIKDTPINPDHCILPKEAKKDK